MDKIISARVDESVARRIGDLALRLRTSRKRVIERAIDMLACSVEDPAQDDAYTRTFGAWKRAGSAESTVAEARRTFRKSLSGRRR
jgi:predicted transcriptional regulator